MPTCKLNSPLVIKSICVFTIPTFGTEILQFVIWASHSYHALLAEPADSLYKKKRPRKLAANAPIKVKSKTILEKIKKLKN